eukprot:TRINITY_DN28977_c0_g1_i1.p1 TRINITY_DN28977_c0_g1~~TRINITY_DN28977_c0_g1_i1.p1  ORF type:complete len:174 (-),score=54.45 TRINITY_DN28977_c0_g1_i1:71-592(-)
MENIESHDTNDTDTIAVLDDNGNFDEGSSCSDSVMIEDKVKPFTNPANIEDNVKDEGTETLSVEKVEAQSLQIKDTDETSTEVVSKDVTPIVSSLDEKAKENIDQNVMDDGRNCTVNKERSVASNDINDEESLDADLESVVAEATKVQSQVLKCIIGAKLVTFQELVEVLLGG